MFPYQTRVADVLVPLEFTHRMVIATSIVAAQKHGAGAISIQLTLNAWGLAHDIISRDDATALIRSSCATAFDVQNGRPPLSWRG